MDTRALRGGRLIEGRYDGAGQLLEIVFADLSVKHFTSVPRDVWQKLIAAPNAATFFEDRIQDEYPGKSAPKRSSRPSPGEPDTASGLSAKSKLNDLFG
jgi:YD repeat-containing protein